MYEEVRKEEDALQDVGGQRLHVRHGPNQHASPGIVVTTTIISTITAAR